MASSRGAPSFAAEALWVSELRRQRVGDKVTWQQQWHLVDFMAKVLDVTEKLERTGR